MSLFIGGMLFGIGIGVALAGAYFLWRNRDGPGGECSMCGRK